MADPKSLFPEPKTVPGKAVPKTTAQELFARFFWPLYPELVQTDLARARSTDANPGKNPSFAAHMQEASAVFVARAAEIFGDDLGLDHSDASVHRLSHALTRARRDAWAADGEAGTARSTLFNVVVHGSAYVSETIVRVHGAEWAFRSPLWESFVELESPLGRAQLAVFQWWLKALSDESLDGDVGTLADRYRAHVEVPRSNIPARSPFLDPGRALPRLSKIRYDVLYKYIKANLPELKDLGKDFPSPERFDELRFRWLQFRVVGDGRMLLVYGPGANGTHLFWLGESGFEKSAFFESDTKTDPELTFGTNTITVGVTRDGTPAVHELLWWGP
ncbi:MAG: hypothetical protein U0169_16720 [Polyangiaceae bacterium]